MPDLLSRLAEHARHTPDRAAIVEPDGLRTTWADLHAEVCAQAARRRTAGNTHAIITLTGADSLLAYLVAQAAGQVPVLVGPNAAMLLPLLKDHFRSGTPIEQPFDPATRTALELPERGDHTVGAIQFSTGSSGTPKGMVRTVGAEYFDALGRSLAMGLRPGDRWLSIEAANPNIALGAFRCVLLLGGTLLLTRQTTPEAIAAATRTGVEVLPLQSHDWRRAVAAGLPPVLLDRGLRVAAITGGHADPRTLAALETVFDGRGQVLNIYGLTECGTVAVAGRADRERGGPLSVGHLVATLRGRIRPVQDPTRTGTSRGEILLAGPAVADHYLLARPDGLWEVEATSDGWLPTADVGEFTLDGDLQLVGRLRDRVEVDGTEIFPHEIELLLESALGADEVVVLQDGGRIVAVLHHGDPSRIGEVTDEVTHFALLDDLPRNAGGKTDRAALAARLKTATLVPTTVPRLERSL